MVHTFTNVCKSNACKFTNIWHEKPNKKRKKRANTSSMWLYVFSHSRGIIHLAGRDYKSSGVTRGAIYWHFKDKSDLFSEIWELSESNIGELELEYQAKFHGDPLSVLRDINSCS